MTDDRGEVVHLFGDKLAESQDPITELFWDEVYDRIWPGCHVVRHLADGPAQRAGYGVVIVHDGVSIRVEEKVREEDYGDVFLETISNDRTGAPGWIERSLLCDWLAYGIPSARKALVFPWPLLRAAWRWRGEEWASVYGVRRAPNHGYWTHGVPVPVREIWKAIFRVATAPLVERSSGPLGGQ